MKPKRLLLHAWAARGDAAWIGSILPLLKAEGWHITVITSFPGAEVLRHDPHIDELIPRARPLVSIEHGGYYQRVIDLTLGPIGTVWMLPKPQHPRFHDSDEERRRRCAGQNYVELFHQFSDVGGPYAPRVYVTEDERLRARGRKGEGSALMVAVGGSTEHKFWPWQATLVDLVVRRTRAEVFMVGDRADRERLADAFNIDPRAAFSSRVTDLCGEIGMRDAIALAQVCDAVVGPETGILSCVAMEPSRKVVLLSHSTAYNLTRDWTNTIALAPAVPCHPCHRWHLDTKHCPRGPSGRFAACAEAIEPERVFQALGDALEREPMTTAELYELPDGLEALLEASPPGMI